MLTVHIYQPYRTTVLNMDVSSSTCQIHMDILDAHVRCTCAMHLFTIHNLNSFVFEIANALHEISLLCYFDGWMLILKIQTHS